ncbi:glutathione S-transferase family protein [Qipengyuania sp. 6B39]|uniref:glutathione S-transferase family protein n=1 Tax=Qipengyuania proteolytica TaxID=2867239 RepID=UPI001C8ACAC5|nr:glutathione S-transferase family protein [Qipengyuania proteolytica]MBX7494297.1 glutathione S-transferase family protein [Qipengyuania proteolytica]
MSIDRNSRPVITGFRWVPDFARGFVKDLRVRWACEEVGRPYEERLVTDDFVKGTEYRKEQPFGQVPVYREGQVALFESGAIVLHIANQSSQLMPSNPVDAARVVSWMFAAIASIEPFVSSLADIDLFHADEEWAKLRRTAAVEQLSKRLDDLSDALGGRDYLVDEFSGADLLMACVLRDISDQSTFERHPNLVHYLARCTARPAFVKALESQLTSLE